MMLGFRSKTLWKSMLAIMYYALSFLGFAGGVYIGVAILAVAWVIPTFCMALYEAVHHGKKEQYYAIPVFVTVMGISAVFLGIDYDTKINSATAVNAVAETKLVYEPSITETPVSDKVYITSSGTRYHEDGCRFIKNKQTIAVTVSEAASRGLTPCGVCSE